MTMEMPSDSQSTDRYPIGTVAYFDCSDPHEDLVGNHLLLCYQDDEGKTEWNGHLPYCGNYLLISPCCHLQHNSIA